MFSFLVELLTRKEESENLGSQKNPNGTLLEGNLRFINYLFGA